MEKKYTERHHVINKEHPSFTKEGKMQAFLQTNELLLYKLSYVHLKKFPLEIQHCDNGILNYIFFTQKSLSRP